MSILDKKKLILKISYENQLAHIGSCISVLPILEGIYKKKRKQDLVLMDNAHAHLAHLLYLWPQIEALRKELKMYPMTASIWISAMLSTWGIHCDVRAGCDASGGSLGHAFGIAIGMALADRKRDIYLTVSNGSMMEGSNWEALRIKQDLKLTNIKIYCNFNGYIATKRIDDEELAKRMKVFDPDINFRFTDFSGIKALKGIEAHYKVLNKEEYEQSLKDVIERDFMESSGV